MKLQDRISAFTRLGHKLGTCLHEQLSDDLPAGCSKMHETINKQQEINGWFVPQQVRRALEALIPWLSEETLTEWTARYPGILKGGTAKTIGVVMAGNLPLAGFHDFLAVLVSGHRIRVKRSEKDPELLPLLANLLIKEEPRFRDLINLSKGPLKPFDAIIATGSNNTSRYFEYYFGSRPNIIRKNRNGVALLTGKETKSEIESLGDDVFTYYGMGCRNVSKIYLPEGFDPESLMTEWNSFDHLPENKKYNNNYHYQRSVLRVQGTPHYDNGFVLLREHQALASPVAVLHFEYYRDKQTVKQELNNRKEQIQCIMGHGYLPFGTSQHPGPEDYADGVDTMDFLQKQLR